MSKQEIEAALEHQHKILRVLRSRLEQRELQEAQYGLNTPPEISNEIHDLKQRIYSVEQEIARLDLLAVQSLGSKVPQRERVSIKVLLSDLQP